MAKFEYCLIKVGYEGKKIKTALSISKITFSETDEVVEIPSSYEGKQVEYVGYEQGVTEAHVRFHDWHHPAQGDGEYVPTEYYPKENYFFLNNLNDNVKKIIFPKADIMVYYRAFNRYSNQITYVIDEITGYKTNEKGEIVYK